MSQEPEMTMNGAFKPVLKQARLLSDRVRPGDFLGVTYVWRNEGAASGAADYQVFAHIEPEKSCKRILASEHHSPAVPTTQWQPGKRITDGPHCIAIPGDLPDGAYWLHVGVFQWEPKHVRFCDVYVQQITVSADAASLRFALKRLTQKQLAARTAALDARLASAQAIENEHLRVEVAAQTGVYKITDKSSRVAWHSDPVLPRFGRATLRSGKNVRRVSLDSLQVTREPNALLLCQHLPDIGPQAWVIVQLKLDRDTLEMSYSANGLEVAELTLLDNALWTTDADAGYVVIPVRMGLMLPADSGLLYERSFPTFSYSGCHMEMFGVVRRGSAVLVTWHDPYVTPRVQSTFPMADTVPGTQVLLPAVSLSGSARGLRIRFLGKGDYCKIAAAYRDVAQAKGYIERWPAKIKRCKDAAKLIGAIDVRCSNLSRQLNDKGREVAVHVPHTFEQSAQLAEHLKKDLKLDKVLLMLSGWIHRGYDNQHPDILPAAPECGGNDALARCAARVKKLGYLICAHDNYQDIYRDSPSWNEDYIMKDPGGKIVKGGKWAGGQCWVTCSKKALELAQRPQNLTEVKRLFGLNSYFIDTTFAVGLYECFDSKHPLTKWHDMYYKSALSDYARSMFGVFGSECGREWAIPHADFFEGLAGVSGKHFHNWSESRYGGHVVPMFEMVYHDCIANFAKYGFNIRASAAYVLHHAILGRPMQYNAGGHLYWQREEAVLDIEPRVAEVKRIGPRRFAITYEWHVKGSTDQDLMVFVHFTDSEGKIIFQNDHEPSPRTSQWKPGVLRQGPNEVEVPDGVRGQFEIRMGLYDPKPDARARLKGQDDGQRRIRVGALSIGARKTVLKPVEVKDQSLLACFCRADSGWAEGMCLADRLMKNTYELLSPLHEVTAEMVITRHEFLTEDRNVQRSVFGDDVSVVANFGEAAYSHRSREWGEVKLPACGVFVESPGFVAFHAQSFNGLSYDAPVMFTLRSLDGKRLAESRKVRIFHGFGCPDISFGPRKLSVAREMVWPRHK